MAARKQRLTDEQVGARLRRILYERSGGPIRAVTYDRVSTVGQVDGTSLETQELDTTDWCADRGIEIVKRYVEPGETGRNDHRPQFQAMISDLAKLNVQAVVVAAADRFARDARLHLNEIERFRDLGVVFVSINEPLDYSTASGRHQLIDEANRAELYSNKLSERMKRANLHLARRGLWLGPPPVGYARPDERGPLVITDDATAVQLAFSLYATGQYSYSTLADALNRHDYTLYSTRKGGRTAFDKWNVRELLGQIGYIGKIRYRGVVYEGGHEPIIDQQTWDKVQALVAERGARRATVATSKGTGILGDILFCEVCGDRMWIHNNHRRQAYYVCSGRWRRTCTTKGIAQQALEPQVFDLLQRLALPASVRDEVLDMVQTLHAERSITPTQPGGLDDVTIERRLSNLKDLYISEDISREEYETRKAGVLAQRRPASGKRAAGQAGLNLRVAAALLERPYDLIINGSIQHQRAMLRQLFAGLWAINDNGLVEYQPRENYLPLVAAIITSPLCSSVSRVGNQYTQLHTPPYLCTGWRIPYIAPQPAAR